MPGCNFSPVALVSLIAAWTWMCRLFVCMTNTYSCPLNSRASVARAASMKASSSVPGFALKITCAKSRGLLDLKAGRQVLAISSAGLKYFGFERFALLGCLEK